MWPWSKRYLRADRQSDVIEQCERSERILAVCGKCDFNARIRESTLNADSSGVFTDETRQEERDISSAMGVFHARTPPTGTREITVINFRGAISAGNLLMQIRRSHNARAGVILIDDPRERFVSFSPATGFWRPSSLYHRMRRLSDLPR